MLSVGVICIYFIIFCVYYYNGVTQKPQDHLFQKSGQQEGRQIFSGNTLNSKKVMFHHGIETKYVVIVVICIYFIKFSVYYYNGVTQKPQDHLFQKSGQQEGRQIFPVNTLNSKKVMFHHGIETKYFVSVVICIFSII